MSSGNLTNLDPQIDSDDANDDDDDDDDDADDWDHPIGGEAILSEAEQGDMLWRLAKVKLEAQNTARFLKARPRFLPYQDCRKWVQAWSRWKTKEDWYSWISLGEKRNAYIPSEPDKYYSQTGDWKGWPHFLGMEDDDNVHEGFQ